MTRESFLRKLIYYRVGIRRRISRNRSRLLLSKTPRDMFLQTHDMTVLRLYKLFDLKDAVFSATEAACYVHTFLTVANSVFLRIYLPANARVYQRYLMLSNYLSVSLLLSLSLPFFPPSFLPYEGRWGKGKQKTSASFIIYHKTRIAKTKGPPFVSLKNKISFVIL